MRRLRWVWIALVIMVLPSFCAAREWPITLEGRWQFSTKETSATAFIQQAFGHLTLACYAGDPLLEMQLGESLYPYHGIPEVPIVVSIQGKDTYIPDFEIGMGGYWLMIPMSHPLISDLRRGSKVLIGDPVGPVTATASLAGSYAAIGKLLNWCADHANN